LPEPRQRNLSPPGQFRLASLPWSGHDWVVHGIGPVHGPAYLRKSFMLWKALLALIILLIIGGVGLAIYGGRLEPQQQRIEQVLPDDRFPR